MSLKSIAIVKSLNGSFKLRVVLYTLVIYAVIFVNSSLSNTNVIGCEGGVVVSYFSIPNKFNKSKKIVTIS